PPGKCSRSGGQTETPGLASRVSTFSVPVRISPLSPEYPGAGLTAPTLTLRTGPVYILSCGKPCSALFETLPLGDSTAKLIPNDSERPPIEAQPHVDDIATPGRIDNDSGSGGRTHFDRRSRHLWHPGSDSAEHEVSAGRHPLAVVHYQRHHGRCQRQGAL